MDLSVSEGNIIWLYMCSVSDTVLKMKEFSRLCLCLTEDANVGIFMWIYVFFCKCRCNIVPNGWFFYVPGYVFCFRCNVVRNYGICMCLFVLRCRYHGVYVCLYFDYRKLTQINSFVLDRYIMNKHIMNRHCTSNY